MSVISLRISRCCFSFAICARDLALSLRADRAADPDPADEARFLPVPEADRLRLPDVFPAAADLPAEDPVEPLRFPVVCLLPDAEAFPADAVFFFPV